MGWRISESSIGVLAGDGIGPEITDAAIEVLHAATERTGLKLRLTHCLVGWKAREQEGNALIDIFIDGLHRSPDKRHNRQACDAAQSPQP